MAFTPWYKDMSFYQIWPRSFMDGNGDGIGDLWGVYDRLDYIKSLNVDGIWFSPLYPSPNADFGYDISDYTDISEEYGGMEAFDAVLQGAHERGLKVIMDLVVNHTSDEHPWFQASRRRQEPYKNYYIWRDARSNGRLPNNWLSLFEGRAWQWDEERQQYYLHLFAVRQPDLNMDNPAVRAEVKRIMRFWLDKGVDGFREDVITFISKEKGLPDGFPLMPAARGIGRYNHGPHVHEYLQEFRHDVLDKYDCVTLAEAPMVTPKQALEYISEDGNGDINMMIHFQHMNADCFMNDYYPLPFSLLRLKAAFDRWQRGLAGRGWNCLYLENHDHARVISRYGSERFRSESGKALAAAYLFQQGTPFVYQGQEIGMTNIRLDSIEQYEDVQTVNQYRNSFTRMSEEKRMRRIWHASRESARTPMQWSDEPHAGFTEGTPWFYVNQNYTEVNVDAQERDPHSLLNFYRDALRIRKELPVVRSGKYRDLRPLSPKQYVYERTARGTRLLVICSFSDRPMRFTAPRGYDLDKGRILLCSHPVRTRGRAFMLRPYETRVYYFDGKRKKNPDRAPREAGASVAESE